MENGKLYFSPMFQSRITLFDFEFNDILITFEVSGNRYDKLKYNQRWDCKKVPHG